MLGEVEDLYLKVLSVEYGDDGSLCRLVVETTDEMGEIEVVTLNADGQASICVTERSAPLDAPDDDLMPLTRVLVRDNLLKEKVWMSAMEATRRPSPEEG